MKTKLNPVLLVLLVIPLLGIIGAALTIAANGGLNPVPPTPAPVTLATSRLVGRAAPNFELPTLENPDETLRLSSLRGRMVFVNFWATWCEPCVRELPAFESFMFQQGDDASSPVILTVNIGEEVEVIEKFLANIDITGLPVLLDTDYRAQTAYDADLFPSTFVIDKAGVVQEMHLGEMKLSDLNNYVERFG